jgi:hypothetical protein
VAEWSKVEAGIDPLIERRKDAGIPTFREAAVLVFAENKKNWRNAKHKALWLSTLTAYAFPHFGDMSVSDVEGPHVRDVLGERATMIAVDLEACSRP